MTVPTTDTAQREDASVTLVEGWEEWTEVQSGDTPDPTEVPIGDIHAVRPGSTKALCGREVRKRLTVPWSRHLSMACLECRKRAVG